MTIKSELIELSQKMADLTAPKCANECNLPHSCCDPMYCEGAIDYAKKHWDVELQRTEHPKLPMMGEDGCTVPPHLRPMCTVHVCEKHYMLDIGFAQEYFDLRDRLSTLLLKYDAGVEE